MSLDWTLEGHNAKLTVRMDDRRPPEPPERWVETEVALRVGPFAANYRATFLLDELQTFVSELEEALKAVAGTARFDRVEDQLVFSVEMGHRGTAAVTGTAREDPVGALAFTFDTDQSYLQQALLDLRNAVRKLATPS
jgi:hypothetical protein